MNGNLVLILTEQAKAAVPENGSLDVKPRKGLIQRQEEVH
jgi:hypothetical protein